MAWREGEREGGGEYHIIMNAIIMGTPKPYLDYTHV